MSALPKRYFTQEEYVLVEERSPYKSQFVAGEIFSMDDKQPWEVRIMGNIVGMLYVRFRGRDCVAFGSMVNIHVRDRELWTYPDAVALCGEPRFDSAANRYSLLNPQVIFEVLSPSTAAFDRGDKFARYQRLESFVDYVLIDSERMRVEHYVRQDAGGWLYREYHDPADVLRLASVGADLPLAEIYERVEFPVS